MTQTIREPIVSSMTDARHEVVVKRLCALANETPPATLELRLCGLAKSALDAGYPRGRLLEDFERLRAHFEHQGEEEREDAVLAAMELLYGWGSHSPGPRG